MKIAEAICKEEGVGLCQLLEKYEVQLGGETIPFENGILPPRMSCEPLFRIQSHFGIRPQQLFSILSLRKT